MATLKELTKARGALKTRLTLFRKFVERFETEDTHTEKLISELEHRISVVECALEEFNSVQLQIEQLVEDDDLEAQTDHRIDFENNAFEYIAVARSILHRGNEIARSNAPEDNVRRSIEIQRPTASVDNALIATQTNNTTSENITSETRTSYRNESTARMVKLPTINLPVFDGSTDLWLEFFDLFKALIHDDPTIHATEKFYYLRSVLSGSAAEVIKSISLNAINYNIAWDTLCERFQNNELIIDSHVKAIFDLPEIHKENANGIRSLLDAVNKHLRCLKNLGEPTDKWDTLLLHLLLSKLDATTRKEWETRRKSIKERALFSNLAEFLREKWEILEKLSRDKTPQSNNINKLSNKRTLTNYANSTNRLCPICNTQVHPLYVCKEFHKLSVQKRHSEAKRLNLCMNCLRDTHSTNQCKTLIACRRCNKRHNTMLHLDYARNTELSVGSTNAANNSSATEIKRQNTNTPIVEIPTVSTNHANTSNREVLLSTALINLKDRNGILRQCRAFLDVGSQSSYITEDLVKELGLKSTPCITMIGGINDSSSKSYSKICCTIYSRVNSRKWNVTLLILPKITEDIPTSSFDQNLICKKPDVLADPDFNVSNKIDVLLGADIFWELLSTGQMRQGKKKPIWQNTELGWILGGKLNITEKGNHTQSNVSINSCNNIDLDNSLTKFWEIENMNNKFKSQTPEERKAEQLFKQGTTRSVEGRFVVRIPFHSSIELGASKYSAECRFYSLERKLQSDAKLRKMYTEFINDYEYLGHMSLVDDSAHTNNDKLTYYLPHHAVVKEESKTTKLRVVFDASAKTDNGFSLNDMQLTGPIVQSDLYSILLRFRMKRYILSADVTKMYRQILVAEDQRPLQRILWRDNPKEKLKTYQLNTVTYGMTAAPYLATRCLKQISIESKEEYPVESSIIETDFYVDDLLTGCNDLKSLITIKQNITNILKASGFELRKFTSNSNEAVAEMTDSDPLLNLTSGENKTLGIRWSSNSDTLYYKTNLTGVPNKKAYTKREVTSIIASIFDPLGLVAPLIIKSKLFIQGLWRLKVNWDDILPDNIHCGWTSFIDELKLLGQIKIPRLVSTPECKIILHGFCDASEKAYGACVYIQCVDSNKVISVNLLTAKSRVAPLQQLTLPRLELCGAVLLSELITKVGHALKISVNITEMHFWTDSTIVIHWLNSPSTRWKTFVANRVSEIQTSTDINHWHHIRSAENPADLLSRGCSLDQLIDNSLWWHGPQILMQLTDTSSSAQNMIDVGGDVLEERAINTIALTTQNKPAACELFAKYSQYNKLLYVCTFMYRFIKNAQTDKQQRETGPLTTNEMHTAKVKLISLCQSESFPGEITNLRKGDKLSKSSKILALNPFLDKNNILRVGGRLKHANLNFDNKHPILLDSNHRFTKMLAESEHRRLLHCGSQTLLYALRQTYWPLNGRNLTRKVSRKCLKCFKVNPQSENPLMGNLPKQRVEQSPPFQTCGTDFAGPVLARDRKGRGCKTIKVYICLFVCFATKAYHVEIVSDLTTENFISCLKRFIARRGRPTNIYSDNGTNYVGANNELKKVYKFLKQSSNQVEINNFLKQELVTWHFIPPRAPHFGGLWESGIKSIKTHLKRTIANAFLTYEELSTVTAQIEAILNSRPLSPISTDPDDCLPLTPAHFLIGRPLTALPELNVNELQINRLNRYQLAQRITQDFWRRWQKEYLHQVQERSKWKTTKTEPKIGDLVIIKDENTQPLQWKLGRLTKLHPGTDNIVRVVTLKTVKGELKRPIHKLCLLPEK